MTYALQRTLDDLGFPAVLEALAQRTRTEAGRARASARPFLDTAPEVRAALEIVRQATILRIKDRSLPLDGAPEVRPALERARRGGLLEPKDLIAFARLLFIFTRVSEVLEEVGTDCPALTEIAARLPDLDRLAARVDRCFESDGTISDRASPELREARDRARGLHRTIKGRLDTLLHDDGFLVNLRERYYSVRNGRYVVPVVAQHQAEVSGIVHNASGSGQTLFVEPEALVGVGNQLAIAESIVLEEERRVLQSLTDALGGEAARIEEGIEALARLDEAEACALLAADLDAHAPTVEPSEGPLDLRGLRHPLLVLRGKAVVPNDVRIAEGTRAMVISGPNAGGKTVTLTGVGLCVLMLRAGLFVPADEGSRLPLFEVIRAAVGDAQDLSQDLSTFSAHLLELRHILEQPGQGMLALIDEIAADTNPREGAALAVAVLHELLDRGARVLVTTHLEELKALTHVDARFLNARVGFDARKGTPTYRLQSGEAGSSSAIEIAERMGLPPSVCERAKGLLETAGGPLHQALTALEAERQKLSETEARAQALAEALERERRGWEEERAGREARLREEVDQRRVALIAALDQASEEVDARIRALREAQSLERAEAMRRELAERRRREESARAGSQAEQARVEQPSPTRPEVGGWMHHFGLGVDVEILELGETEAVVSAGAMKMRVPVDQLGPAKAARRERRIRATNRAEAARARAEQAAPGEVPTSLTSCDVRGLRADEALREVEQLLDRAMRASEPGVSILHGHGTGALKQAIRDSLRDSAYVRMFRPGEAHEGGDAVTIVALAE